MMTGKHSGVQFGLGLNADSEFVAKIENIGTQPYSAAFEARETARSVLDQLDKGRRLAAVDTAD
jgi:hypothetical protein